MLPSFTDYEPASTLPNIAVALEPWSSKVIKSAGRETFYVIRNRYTSDNPKSSEKQGIWLYNKS